MNIIGTLCSSTSTDELRNAEITACGSAPKRDLANTQNKLLVYLRHIAFGSGPDRDHCSNELSSRNQLLKRIYERRPAWVLI